MPLFHFSESGRILKVLYSGDFFGEIGILSLSKGQNRSVLSIMLYDLTGRADENLLTHNSALHTAFNHILVKLKRHSYWKICCKEHFDFRMDNEKIDENHFNLYFIDIRCCKKIARAFNVSIHFCQFTLYVHGHICQI